MMESKQFIVPVCNNIGGNTVEKNVQKSKNTTNSVFNTSFDFLQMFI